jgi:hypothetical protein
LYKWLFSRGISDPFSVPKSIFELGNNFIAVGCIDFLYSIAFSGQKNRNIKIIIGQNYTQAISAAFIINLALEP